MQVIFKWSYIIYYMLFSALLIANLSPEYWRELK